MKLIQRIPLLAFIFLMIFLTSCEEEDDVTWAALTVRVTGTLSGNPREDVKITLYATEDDAKNEVNPIAGPEFTNEDGEADFGALTIGKRYWIRGVKVLVYYKQTKEMKSGWNTYRFSII